MARVQCILAVVMGLACLTAWGDEPAPQKPASGPQVSGSWTGVWGAFDPGKQKELDPEKCKLMNCEVTEENGVWRATFDGECGRPYRYSISMEGREANGTVLFKGTADLGPEDGGVYDWVGRATSDSFIGFYTSSHHTGAFHLTRKK